MTALLIGTALAVASVCYVLYPLFRTPTAKPAAPRVDTNEAGSRTCPSCGQAYEADARFCSSCGTPLPG